MNPIFFPCLLALIVSLQGCTIVNTDGHLRFRPISKSVIHRAPV